MMNYFKGVLVLLVVFGFFHGCAESEQSTLMPQNNNKKLFFEIYGDGNVKAPEWVNHPIKGAEKYSMAVVGTADYIEGAGQRKRLKRMKIYAMNEARREMANIMQNVIKMHNYEKSKDTVVDSEDEYSEAVDRNIEEVVKIPVSGLYMTRFTITKDGALHAQAILKPEFLKASLSKAGINQSELKNILSRMKKFDEVHKDMIADAKSNL